MGLGPELYKDPGPGCPTRFSLSLASNGGCFRLSLNEEESEGLVHKKHQNLLHRPPENHGTTTAAATTLQLRPNSVLESRGRILLVLGGSKFGVSPKFVRISMLDKDLNFSLFLKRLSKIQHDK
ncbi:hypothetical protein ACLB2K_068437 [Fragaria x ananassa]